MFKLLVVDDEALEREALKYIVNKSSLEINEVLEAANGQEALAIAEKFDPDIVTLDIMMPGLNGIETGRILRERKPNLKIIFVTAYDSFEYALEAIRIGVEEFIVKPGSDEKTLEILESCIQQLHEEMQKKQEQESLEGKFRQISGYLENEFVNSVVSGDIDEHQAIDYLKFMLSDFTEGFGVVIDLNISENSTANRIYRNMIKKRFAQQLTALLNTNLKFMMNLEKNTIYILVFGYLPKMRNHCVRLIEDEILMASEDHSEQMDVALCYGFGEHYTQISQLWKSFARAKAEARNMQLSRIEDGETIQPTRNSLEIPENDLWMSILSESDEVVIQKADHILDNIIFISNDLNESRLKLYEFFILMSRYLNRESQLKRAVPEYVYDDLRTIESRGEARKYIHGYLFEILEALREQRTSKTPELLEKAISFIHTNYTENITLEEVADEVGFSSYYFSKLFKKTFDITFSDYLTNFRINQARELLANPMMTVKGITYQVGFMDPNYFARVFKKVEGLSPTEYRIKYWRAGAR